MEKVFQLLDKQVQEGVQLYCPGCRQVNPAGSTRCQFCKLSLVAHEEEEVSSLASSHLVHFYEACQAKCEGQDQAWEEQARLMESRLRQLAGWQNPPPPVSQAAERLRQALDLSQELSPGDEAGLLEVTALLKEREALLQQ